MEWIYQRDLNKRYHPTSLRSLLREQWWLTRKQIHFLRSEQAVLVNSQYLPINQPVGPGDHVELHFNSATIDTPVPPFLPDSSLAPNVIFETQDFVVVNKPAGVKTHANQPGELGSMMNFLTASLAPTIPYNVHRLDQATSGALLVAKNPVVLPIFNQQISQKVIKRTYLAVIEGTMTKTIGTINLPIGLDPDDQRKRKINGIDAVSAVTHFQVLESKHHQSLVQLELETGRTHQIRLHLAALGHPIVGDPLYSKHSAPHMFLHSWRIEMPLPFTLDSISLTADLPEYFKNLF